MRIIKPSNAVNAKVMAKYGNRIKEKDYMSMIKLTSIGEVVLYLKNNTHYSKYLDKVNETSIKRGELEKIIRQKIFDEMIQLCRYDVDTHDSVKSYLIHLMETREISRFLYLLNTGQSEEYYLTYPVYLDEYVNLDLKKMSLSKDYDSFLQAIEGSEYYDILKRFSKPEGSNIDIPAIEDALDRYIIEWFHDTLLKYSSGEKDEVEELYNYINDFINVQRIHRMKKYFDMPKEEIMSHLRDYGTISEKKIIEMCSVTDPKDIIKIYQTTKSGKRQNKRIYESSREFYLRSVFYYAESRLHFSQNTQVILICYLLLSQNELFNIINIIEGMRYSLSPEEIESILIYK